VPGTLYLVATPIGNLEDITLRAIRVLREAAVVAAEDTRHTGKLLAHLGIHTQTTSFYEQNELERIPRLISRLTAGESVALVSDAGTPGISDPGYRLVRAAIEAGIPVEAVPGASAVLTALVASGLPTNAFAFLGFAPPRAQARERWLASLATRQETIVFFEAPHRVRETLEAAARILGDRTAMVGRELTKLHEEKIRGRLTEILGQLTETRGEFTIVLAPADPAAEKPPIPDNPALYREFCDLTENEGLGRRAAISRLAERYGVPSRLVYSAVERGREERPAS